MRVETSAEKTPTTQLTAQSMGRNNIEIWGAGRNVRNELFLKWAFFMKTPVVKIMVVSFRKRLNAGPFLIACLLACPPACLLTCLLARFLVCLLACWLAGLLVCWLAGWLACWIADTLTSTNASWICCCRL